MHSSELITKYNKIFKRWEENRNIFFSELNCYLLMDLKSLIGNLAGLKAALVSEKIDTLSKQKMKFGHTF